MAVEMRALVVDHSVSARLLLNPGGSERYDAVLSLMSFGLSVGNKAGL
jgi:hypothetical protein